MAKSDDIQKMMAATHNFPIGAAIVGPIILLMSPLLFKYTPKYCVYVLKNMKLPNLSDTATNFVAYMFAAGTTFIGIALTIYAIASL